MRPVGAGPARSLLTGLYRFCAVLNGKLRTVRQNHPPAQYRQKTVFDAVPDKICKIFGAWTADGPAHPPMPTSATRTAQICVGLETDFAPEHSSDVLALVVRFFGGPPHDLFRCQAPVGRHEPKNMCYLVGTVTFTMKTILPTRTHPC